MIWAYRVAVAALLVCCGLLGSGTSDAATVLGMPQRVVEDSPGANQISPPPPPPLPIATATPTRRSAPPAPPRSVPTPVTSNHPAIPPAPPLTAAALKPARVLLAAINRERAAHRAPALTLDVRQSRCSLGHSLHMAQLGYISHDQFPGDLCVQHSIAGENVGVAYGSSRDAVLYLNQAMLREGPCAHKPCSLGEFAAHGHYTNLVDPQYTRLGIGIYYKNGITWLTEDFVE